MAAAGALVALLLALSQDQPLPEGNAFVRSLVGRQRQQEQALNRYSYDVLVSEEDLNASGIATKREAKQYEVFYVKGLPVRRQTHANGRPLAAKAQAKQDREVQHKVEKITQGLVAREEPGLRLSQVLERYDFRSIGRETLDARPVIVLDFTARKGKRDLDSDNVLRALFGRIWVDEQDRAVVRAEIRNSSGIKFGLGLGASLKSLDLKLEFRRMDDGVVLPWSVSGTASGRILIFKSFRKRQTTSYSNYRRFEVDSEERFDASVPR
jgi:hypothetical protein